MKRAAISARGPRSAFTLLELLVAVAITLVIAGLMLAVTLNVLRLWQRTQGAQARAVSARQVLDLVERDLQTALRPRDARCWLAADILDSLPGLANHGWYGGTLRLKPSGGASLRLVPAPDASGTSRLADARFGLSGVWLRLVATNVESGGSLPTVVAWQLARRPVTGDFTALNPAPIRYGLYRSAVGPAETFASGYEVTAAAYGSSTNTPTSALSTAYRQPRNVTNPSQANLLAPNVVDFGCWLYAVQESGPLVRIYPADASDLAHQAVGAGVSAGTRFPDVADVLVRILSDEGAVLVEAIERGQVSRPPEYVSDDDWWWAVVETHSEVFVRRIVLRGGGP